MQTSPAIETEDKDLPLREDIRLLGRILGDTIREQPSSTRSRTIMITLFSTDCRGSTPSLKMSSRTSRPAEADNQVKEVLILGNIGEMREEAEGAG